MSEILGLIDFHLEKDGKVLVVLFYGYFSKLCTGCHWLLQKNPCWSWKDALSYVKKSSLIALSVEIRESILYYLEAIEEFREDY